MYAWYNDNCLDDVVEIEHTLMYIDDIYIYIYIYIVNGAIWTLKPFDLKFRSLYQKKKGDICIYIYIYIYFFFFEKQKERWYNRSESRIKKDQLKLIVKSNSDIIRKNG